jgi:predicted dehydrogenase
MRIAVTGDHGQLVFDDKSVSKVKLLLGDQSLHPEYPDTPPLLVELQAFLGMVEGRIPNTSQLEDAAQVIQVLDAIERSCELGGERIQISS